MSNMDCIKKAALDSRKRILSGRSKITKMVKKFLAGKRKPNAVTPSTCNYDVVESVQNDLNESELFQLHFKFYGSGLSSPDRDATSDENRRNEELEERLMQCAEGKDLSRVGVVTRVADGGDFIVEQLVQQATFGTYFAVPVQFVESASGDFVWAPLPDRDVSRHGDESPISGNQVAEQQVPVMITSAA